jgi:spermidine synthase
MVALFAFFAGAILMSLEIVGSRILAPQYGNSVVVWASLIGVFMAALATGYWLGGLLADRWPRRGGVGVVLAIAGLLTTLIPLAAPYVFAMAGDSLRRGSLLAAMGLFFLPTTLMGTVSPYAIRLQEIGEGRLGRTAGRLYAISTVGSILGTLVTAFWLIPLAGVAMLVVSLGIALLVLASVTFASALTEGANRSMAIASLAVAIILGSSVAATGRASVMESLFGQPQSERLLIEKDSLYHHIRVSDEGGIRYLRFDKHIQTSMPLANHLGTGYVLPEYFHLARIIRPSIRSVLLIGLGGATIPKQFLSEYPDVTMDAVEIDDEVAVIARRWFYQPPESDRFHVYVEDGRRFLATHPEKKYDYIIIDAFHADSLPFHLFTTQFFELCRAHLNANGLIGINLIGAREGPNSGVVASVYQTVGGAFPERYVFPIGFHMSPSRFARRNVCLIAGQSVRMSEAELRAAAMKSAHPHFARYVVDLESRPPDTKYAKTLSDDYAPVDDLLILR